MTFSTHGNWGMWPHCQDNVKAWPCTSIAAPCGVGNWPVSCSVGTNRMSSHVAKKQPFFNTIRSHAQPYHLAALHCCLYSLCVCVFFCCKNFAYLLLRAAVVYTVFWSHDVCAVVGESGQVLSFEQREDHLSMARRNYQTWQLSTSLHHPHSADNVLFLNRSITEASQHTHTPVDAVRDLWFLGCVQ